MSIIRLATATVVFSLLTSSIYAQDCGCNSTGFAPLIAIPGGCTQGSSNGRNQNCVSADGLWAGFAENTCCKGCVKINHFRPQLPTLGLPCGLPSCGIPRLGFNRCGSGCEPNACQNQGSGEPRLRDECSGLNGCGINARASVHNIHIPVPHISVNWPRPLHTPNADCCSTQPKLLDGLNVFGTGRQKNVRCDIPNDYPRKTRRES